jgi:hypothetical protein
MIIFTNAPKFVILDSGRLSILGELRFGYNPINMIYHTKAGLVPGIGTGKVTRSKKGLT